jgi:hypothetical protein
VELGIDEVLAAVRRDERARGPRRSTAPAARGAAKTPTKARPRAVRAGRGARKKGR